MQDLIIKIAKYARWSSIDLAIQLNPIRWWMASWFVQGPTDMDPGSYCLSIRFIMFRLNVILDDGSY